MLKTNKKNTLFFGWLVCLLGAVFYCYEYLLRIEPSVIVPELLQHFNTNATNLGLAIAMYYYAYTPLQLIVGMLIDRYGTRLVLTFAVIACTFGSYLFGNSHSIYILGIARFIIGFGSAFAFVACLKLASEWLPHKHFALFTGITTTLGMLGAMAGTMSLTFAIHRFGWENTILIGTIIGVIVTPLIFFVIHDTPDLIENRKNKSKITFHQTFHGFMKIVKNNQIWLNSIVACLFYLSLSTFAELWGIPFLRSVYALSLQSSAIACSMVFAGWLFGAPLSGWLSDKFQTRKKPLLVGGILMTICIGLIVIKPWNMSFYMLCTLLLLFGFGSSVEIICFAITRENCSKQNTATSIGFTNSIIMLGGMLFQPLFGFILDLFWSGEFVDGSRFYSINCYKYALYLLPILMLIGTLLSLKLKDTYSKHVSIN